MQQIKSPSVDNLPKIGYYVSKEDKKKNFYENETHIHKQGPLSGIKAGAHKLTNDVFTYFPKGFQGSKNSDFYEYLSLGMVPYLIGSVLMFSTYKGANKFFNFADKLDANSVARGVGAGIVMYGVGKWATKKLARTLIHASTGVDLNMQYLKKVNELPEQGRDEGIVRVQYPGVFDSPTFYRSDLLDKYSDLTHDNIFWYNDKIAKKAGFKEQLNAPGQTVGPKIKALKTRTTALENINQYITAACAVALGAQKGFRNMKPNPIFVNKKINVKNLSGNLKGLKNAFTDSFAQLWKGTNRNLATKHGGKALLIASAAATLLTWLIPAVAFKRNPDPMKSKVDTKKEYEVC